MSGGSQISGFHQLVVQPRLVEDFSRMPYSSRIRLKTTVLPNFRALLTQPLNHGRYLRGQVSVLHLHLLELQPVRHVRQFPQDISRFAVVQSLVRSPGDVLQPELLYLQVLQPVLDPLERIFSENRKRRDPRFATWSLD